METRLSISGNRKVLKASRIDTPLGPMLAIADEKALYLLEFAERRSLEREIEQLLQKAKGAIIPGTTQPIESIKNELAQYFEQGLCKFHTPLFLMGTPFQKSVWEELQKIPPGETRSYMEIAKAIGKPKGFRAVARANGSNQLAIVIPCHRVIKANGEIGGYAAGIDTKKSLLALEKR
ncbi:MAG: methylated-DNA--[protein]-cysteine S-methyltransferase [Waddliaceae bacterium]